MRMESTHAKAPSGTKHAKQAVNVSLPIALIKAARSQGINFSSALEDALREKVRTGRNNRWSKDNAKAIAAYNRDVEEHGTFGDRLRQF